MKSKFCRSESFLFPLIAVAIILISISCKSSDKNTVEFRDGISLPIWELLGDDLINVLENDLDFPIYRGDSPPDVEEILLSSSSSPNESTVVMRPAILGKTNVPKDNIQPGDTFRDILIRIENLNMDNLTVQFDRIVLGSPAFLGENSYIIGNGNQFTVFGKQSEVVEQDTVISVNFFSGTVEDGGISSAKGGIIVVENHGIGIFIPNGTGRLFEDEDGFSDLDEWPQTGTLKAKDEMNRNSLIAVELQSLQ